MQKSLHIISLFLISVLLLSSCRSAKKSFEHGNYYEASMFAIQKLRSSPKNKKAKMALQQAYPLLIRTTESKINNLKQLNSDNRNRSIYNTYVRLNRVYDGVQTCPAALQLLANPKSFYPEQNEWQKLAFEECMGLGDRAMSLKTKSSARKAYYLYQEALKYDALNSEAQKARDIAFDKAVVKVVMEQIPVVGAYDFSCSFFYDQIFTALNSDRRAKFLHFYRAEEAEKIELSPDHIIRMSFDDFVVGKVLERIETNEISKDSVVVGSVTLDDGTKMNAYNTVKAKLTTRRKTLESKGLLAIQVVDFNTGALLSHEKFPGTFIWESVWGSFNGDERALTEKQKKVCQYEPATPPPALDLFVEFTKPIYSSASAYVIQFYKNSKYN